MDNYEYCSQYALNLSKDRPFKVLDYGCGSGKIVAGLREQGVEAYGCDVFYGGSDLSTKVPSDLMGDVILKMEDGCIPFPSEFFDLVINNQVLEHVEDLNFVLFEIQRVVKKGGKALCLFPDRSVWREGHCGIPFLHWFPKGNKMKIFYAMFLRMLGLGNYKKKKSPYQWSKDFCGWLDKWTYYRPYKEIMQSFETKFTDIRHIEDDWLDKRLEDKKYWPRWFPKKVKQMITRKLGGMVFVCAKK